MEFEVVDLRFTRLSQRVELRRRLFAVGAAGANAEARLLALGDVVQQLHLRRRKQSLL